MRLFVGLNISDEIRDSISKYVSELQNQLGPGIKWVRPETLHVTLKFIGETDRANEIEDSLRCVRSPAVEMSFRGVGFFTPQSPRVFWAGVEAGVELGDLAEKINRILGPLGVSKEPYVYQQYQPHLTLARVGSGKPAGSIRDRNKMPMWILHEKVSSLAVPHFGTMTANEFILYRSETSPGGPRYTPLSRIPLG